FARDRCIHFHYFHYVFFFSCFGHSRDLHSFPTRRSSDLVGLTLWAVGVSAIGILFVILTKTIVQPLLAIPGLAQYFAVFVHGAIDRKSTRLNSSHVSISYAVFCLKKKKKQNQIHY